MPCLRQHDSPRDRDGTCQECRRLRQRAARYNYIKRVRRRKNATALDRNRIQKLRQSWES